MSAFHASDYSEEIRFAYLKHKLNQLHILISYLTLDYKPDACDDYVTSLEEWFSMSHRDIAWRALCDRSFDEKPFLINSKEGR